MKVAITLRLPDTFLAQKDCEEKVTKAFAAPDKRLESAAKKASIYDRCHVEMSSKNFTIEHEQVERVNKACETYRVSRQSIVRKLLGV